MSTAPLKFGPSGLRGIAYDSLTKEVIQQHVEAFIAVLQPQTVVVGMDTRASGPDVYEWTLEVLKKYGCDIINIGIVSTPTAQFMTRTQDADGGIAITASHNPPEYNGLKFFTSEGRYLDEITIDHVKDRMMLGSDLEAGVFGETTISHIDDTSEQHVRHVLAHINVEVIKNSGLKVVIDPDCGAGAVIDPVFISEIGLDNTSIIHSEPSAEFPRGTEPTPENLKILGKTVKGSGADVGFAQDPDADRLAIVDAEGIPIGEEYTLAFAVDYILSKQTENKNLVIATNLSTSRMMDDVAKKHGAKLIRTKIGEMYVADALSEEDGIIGGEGNGGVIWPTVSFGRDSIAGMAIILEYMATTGKSIRQLVDELPKYEAVKDKKEVESREEVEAILAKVKEVYADYEIDLTDGVKVIFENGWLHVRASNTEPIVRYFAEAPTREQAEVWVSKVK